MSAAVASTTVEPAATAAMESTAAVETIVAGGNRRVTATDEAVGFTALKP